MFIESECVYAPYLLGG